MKSTNEDNIYKLNTIKESYNKLKLEIISFNLVIFRNLREAELPEAERLKNENKIHNEGKLLIIQNNNELLQEIKQHEEILEEFNTKIVRKSLLYLTTKF